MNVFSQVWIYAVLILFKLFDAVGDFPHVWIYAVLTLIQTTAESVFRRHGLDICRINSYSNYSDDQRVFCRLGYMPY